jgi:Rrf2 family protein
MTFGTGIRHALYAVLDLARADESNPVSVASIAHRHHIPETALAKVFQRLVRSGLVVGTRGPHGGYRLVRPASEITVLDVMNAFEPAPPARAHPAEEVGDDDSLERFFGAVDGQARTAFASVTIDQLAERTRNSL